MPTSAKCLGYDEEELLAMTFQEVTHPEDLQSEQPYLARLVAGTIQHYRFSKRYLHKSGRIVWGMLDRTIARDEEGKPAYFISRVCDITAEKAAEPKPTLVSKLMARVREKLGRN